MSQSYNYIKVKSRKQLQQENAAANLVIHKAGIHSTLPGGTHMPIGRHTPEGVTMPPDQAPSAAGEALTGSLHHTWSSSAGIGSGHVSSPAETTTPPLNPFRTRTEDNQFYTRRRSGRTDRPGPGYVYTAATVAPELSHRTPGALDAKYTQGSVGRDIEAIQRMKNARARSRR